MKHEITNEYLYQMYKFNIPMKVTRKLSQLSINKTYLITNITYILLIFEVRWLLVQIHPYVHIIKLKFIEIEVSSTWIYLKI